MDRWRGKVAIVTGASAGIGAEIASALVQAGLKVVGLARRKEKVEELSRKLQGQPGSLHALKTDVSNEDEIRAAFEWTRNNLGPVHILINNAGCTRDTNLSDGDATKWREIFEINVLGLCIATREAVKQMRENKIDGHVVHVNSIAGHRVPNIPNNNVYPASKYAVTALTETLRQELNSMGSKIKITVLNERQSRSCQNGIYPSVRCGHDAHLAEVLKSVPFLEARDVADAVLYVLGTPPHVQVHELTLAGVGLQV